MALNGPEPTRRKNGDARKDVVLRRLNGGEHGACFATTEELEARAAEAAERLRAQDKQVGVLTTSDTVSELPPQGSEARAARGGPGPTT